MGRQQVLIGLNDSNECEPSSEIAPKEAHPLLPLSNKDPLRLSDINEMTYDFFQASPNPSPPQQRHSSS
jgi:hypothetical protein